VRKRIALLAAALAVAVAHAQVGKITQQDWVAGRADAQRTSWIQSDAFISTASMEKPGFALRWRATLADQTQSADALSTGVVVGNLGFGSKPVSFITSRSNRVFAVDNDTGVVFWERAFDGPPANTNSATACAGETVSTAAATRPATLVPTIPVWRGLPERPAYTSGVGAPGEGVPAYLMDRAGRASPPPTAPAPTSNVAPRANEPPAPPLPQVVYTVSRDGRLHTLGLYSGKDVARPLPFLPASAHASDLIALNNVVYAATTGGCGGVADGVWAVDLGSGAVKVWNTDGGSPVGAPAFATDGTLFIAIGRRTSGGTGRVANALVALDPNALTVKDWFVQPNAEFVTAPVVFNAAGRDVVSTALRDGSVILLDASSLGGSTHAVELGRSVVPASSGGAYVPSGLATWEDPGGTRWLLMPTPTGLMAMRVATVGSAIVPLAAWSHTLREPLAPIVVNGVVFVVAGGPEAGVLYALDATTGRELWTSGAMIASPVRRPALWPGIGQVHVATSDNIVYAFGFSMERD